MEHPSIKEIKTFILLSCAPNTTPAKWANQRLELGRCRGSKWNSGRRVKRKEGGREGGAKVEPSRCFRGVRMGPPPHPGAPTLPLWKAPVLATLSEAFQALGWNVPPPGAVLLCLPTAHPGARSVQLFHPELARLLGFFKTSFSM